MNIYNCKILLVDDNQELVQMTAGILRKSGYENILTAYTCESGMDIFKKESPELVILDIMLPDGDGFTMFRKMREISMVPILFLSARDEDNDRLFGLGLGADDYITKPFLPQELVLRVHVILKRAYFMNIEQQVTKDEILELSGHRISLQNATVEYKGKITALTAKELILLKKTLCKSWEYCYF